MHRGTSAGSHHLLIEPHVVPEGAVELVVNKTFAVGVTPPPGFKKNQLPLIILSYTLDSQRVSRVVCDYTTYRKQFAKELLNYFMMCTTFVKTPKP